MYDPMPYLSSTANNLLQSGSNKAEQDVRIHQELLHLYVLPRPWGPLLQMYGRRQERAGLSKRTPRAIHSRAWPLPLMLGVSTTRTASQLKPDRAVQRRQTHIPSAAGCLGTPVLRESQLSSLHVRLFPPVLDSRHNAIFQRGVQDINTLCTRFALFFHSKTSSRAMRYPHPQLR
jgi:hypothetical protein